MTWTKNKLISVRFFIASGKNLEENSSSNHSWRQKQTIQINIFCLVFQQFSSYKINILYELSKFQVKTFYSIAILTAIKTEYINLPQARKSTNKIKIVKHFHVISQHVLFLLIFSLFLTCSIFLPSFTTILL